MAKTTIQIKALVNEIFLFGDGSFDTFLTEDLVELLIAADDAYHNDNEIIPDQNYDALRQYVEATDPTNSYFLGIGSQVRGGKVKLPNKMGSLTQAYQDDTAKWINQHKLGAEQIVVTEKLDGCSAQIVYGNDGKLQIAYSRGDGIEGADITRHVSKIKNVPKVANPNMTIRAEIIFTKADWEAVKTQIKRSGGAFYKNARNSVAGLMNASESDPTAYKYLSVVAYEVIGSKTDKVTQLEALGRYGFTTPVYVAAEGRKLDDEMLTKLLNTMRNNSEYEIDGIVLDVNSWKQREQINPTKDTLNPEYARKFKIADASNLAIATVIEVQWNISKNGYLKPRVKIEPVELVGVTVQHATGFNAKFIQDNGIGKGAQIRITRSGDVIPFILGVVKAATPDMPTEAAVWTKSGVDLVLENANENTTVQLEQLIDFASKVGIDHIGEGNMKAIYDAGYTTVTDFVKMQANDIGLAIGSSIMGKKIQASKLEKTTKAPWYIIAGAHPAFGRGVGVRKMKKLYDAFQGDISKLKNVATISSVEGFDFKTASKIGAGYETFMEFIEDCGSALSFAKYEAPKGGDLSGQTFLFTGFRDKGLEKQIEDKGGKISSSVSSKLTYLVAADPNETSGKLTKARELGTKIITREQLVQVLNG